MQTQSHTQPVKKTGTNKLVLGFAAVVASAVVGTTGLVAAHGMGNADKPTKEQCAAAGFKNYGQCVKEWAHHQGGYGGGYGGSNVTTNTHINANVNLDVKNSNNNVITIILNFFRS
jgi:hypothetical protein